MRLSGDETGNHSVQRIRELIETTVIGLGYDVVDIEFAAAGLLRVYIDFPYQEDQERGDGGASQAAPMIQVGDCEKVSHQLGHVLLVEDFDYERLEVSSPGMDRPLKRASDYRRFAGELVTLRLREPFEGRKNFQGLLTVEDSGKFGLELTSVESGQGGNRRRGKGKSSAGSPTAGSKSAGDELAGQKLVFDLNEVDRARLVPQYEFRRH